MIQVCIMGGHDGLIRPEKKVYLTLFGGCDLKRATVARQILVRRQQRRDGLERPHGQFFLTICGGVEISVPTLAEEFLDLRQMIAAGELSLADWDRAIADLAYADISITSFTLMGGFSECELPSENAEIESLALQRHLGNISEPASQVLQYGIGQRDAERRATLRRAVVAEA
ncbi:MAG: hypothetical protein AABZ12_12980 [Planctomycetota bacterium]